MSTKQILGSKKMPVRFSYAQVFEPKAHSEGEEAKYSVAVLIDKSDKETLRKVKEGVEAAAELYTSKFGGKLPKNYKSPLRDGDEEKPEDENYEGVMFFNASSKHKPEIVDANLEEVMDKEEFYSGCYGRVSINFFPFSGKSKGVAAGLNNLQKTKDGDRLGGGGATAADDFGDDDDLV